MNLKLREDCRYEYTGENNGDYDEQFEIHLKGDNGTFYYQCNKAPFLDSTKGICNYDLASFNINEKGIYKYDHYNPIFKDNTFNIQFSLILISNLIIINTILSLTYTPELTITTFPKKAAGF